jgi:cell division septation protein DedD
MIISPYINELLYKHECVIIPSFGAFVSQFKTASLDANKTAILPPRKEVTFNKLIQNNDGLLINHIASQTERTYDEVKQELQFLVNSWNQMLTQGDKISLEGIGLIYKNNNQLIFEAITSANFDKKSFGLTAVTAKPIAVVPQKVATVQKETVVLETATKPARPYLKYAAAALIGFGLLSFGANWYYGNQLEQEHNSLVKEQQKALEDKIQAATIFVADEVPEIAISVNVVKPKAAVIIAKYHIIIGAFRNKTNAEKQINYLKQQGFDASIVGVNSYGLHQVSAASFNNEIKAINTLHKLQRTVSKSAWLYINTK